MRGRIIDTTLGGRPTCYACFRPSSHCVCGLIPPFTAHCNFLILQHPNEWRKHYSTVRLVKKAIRNSKVLAGIEFDPAEVKRALSGQRAYLLYPRADAQDCRTVLLDLNSTVIVVDGTWEEAGKIVFRNPVLKEFPCLTFKDSLRSNYRIRKQPHEHCLSTIESIGHLLKLNAAVSGLDGVNESYDSLFAGFDRMVEQQLSYFPRMKI